MKECKNCTAPMMEDDKFCAYCGTRLYEELENKDMDSLYVEKEWYNSKGERKCRYVLKPNRYSSDIYAKLPLQPEIKSIDCVFYLKESGWFTCNYEENFKIFGKVK